MRSFKNAEIFQRKRWKIVKATRSYTQESMCTGGSKTIRAIDQIAIETEPTFEAHLEPSMPQERAMDVDVALRPYEGKVVMTMTTAGTITIVQPRRPDQGDVLICTCSLVMSGTASIGSPRAARRPRRRPPAGWR